MSQYCRSHVDRPVVDCTCSAFTLLELLMVIAIIALLACMLTPMIGMARQVARETACRGNLRQIGVAVFSYANDHATLLPAVELPPIAGARPCWAYTLSPYLDREDAQIASAVTWSQATWCPGFRRGDAGASWDSGYGMNDRPGHDYTSLRYSVSAPGFTWASPDPNFVFWSTGQITQVSQRILAGDSFMRTDHALRLLFISGSLQFTNWAFTGPATVNDRCNGDPLRHHGRSNYLFCDGRVDALGPAGAIIGLSRPASACR